jgi:AcrR family transcriptional regulator
MKIAELCRVSGVHRSTVHHYLNLGLLPAPRTLGPKLRHFGPEHVERLRQIQELRAQGLGLAQIRRRLGVPRSRPARVPARPRGPEQDTARTGLLEVAARLFLERGFDGVRVEEIARAAGVGKASVYRQFAGKSELFVACIDRLRWTLVPAELRAAVAAGVPPHAEARTRALAVLSNIDAYRSMNDLLGAAARGRRADVAASAREALHRMVTNAEPSLRRAIAAGLIRGRDSELLAYMLWGALLALGDRLALDDRYDIDEVLAHYLEFVGLPAAGRADSTA